MKKIIEEIEVLAMEMMTEDNVHKDDMPDFRLEYIDKVIKEILEWDEGNY